MEACSEWGYTLSQWLDEPWPLRAKVIAHYMEKKLRESYAMDKVEEKANAGGGSPEVKTGGVIGGWLAGRR